MLELILLPLLALAALSALTMWCCCVVAGQADRRIEALERRQNRREAQTPENAQPPSPAELGGAEGTVTKAADGGPPARRGSS